MKKLSAIKPFKFILWLFLAWQVVIFCLSLFSSILPLRKQFAYNDGPQQSNPKIFWPRANFDGRHYLDIVRNGYGLYEQDFFPLYPNLTRFFQSFWFEKDLLSALFVSNFSLLVFLFVFYKLARLDYDELTSRKSLIFLLIFPTSFFLASVYSESLFLGLILSSFYFCRRKKWFLAGVFGALAAHTRLVGVFIFPALLYEWYLEKKDSRNLKNLLFVFLVPLGLIQYMRFLQEKFNDPLMFVHVQQHYGLERTPDRLILIYQVFWRYGKMILTTKADPLYLTVWLELITAIVFLYLLFLAFRKKIRTSYLIFTLPAYFLPTLTGTFCSLPRFALGFFPCFILLGQIKNKTLTRIIMSVFGLCLVIFAILFFRGYFVS